MPCLYVPQLLETPVIYFAWLKIQVVKLLLRYKTINNRFNIEPQIDYITIFGIIRITALEHKNYSRM